MPTLTRRSVIGAAALSVALVLTACGKADTGASGGSTNSAGGGSSALNVVFIPKNLGNPYFDASDAGGKAAVEELGGTYSQIAPQTGSPDAQVQFINTAAQQRASAIVISANDPKAIGSAMTQAKQSGSKVVTFDSDTEPQFRDMFINQATAEALGTAQMKGMAEQIGDSGEIAILSASANATNQNTWIDYMKKELANHPNITLVDTVYGNDDDQTSFDKTAGLLQTHPNLKGIISPTSVGIAAAARYLSTSDKKGKVLLTGLGTPNQLRSYIKDGTIKEFYLWNPTDLGYLAAYAADALVKGDITGKEGDKFTAGKLGQYTVGANGEVVLGDPLTFDAANIDQFNF